MKAKKLTDLRMLIMWLEVLLMQVLLFENMAPTLVKNYEGTKVMRKYSLHEYHDANVAVV